MAALDPAQIAAYARQAGFPEDLIPTKVAIAMAESSGNPMAHNPNVRTGDNSYGLWQINMLGGMGPERRKQFGIERNEDLFDPTANARAAKSIYDNQGLGAWSVYRSGRYKDFLGQAQAAAQQQVSVPAGGNRSGTSIAGDPLGALTSSLMQGITSGGMQRAADPLADVALAGLGTSFSEAAGLRPAAPRTRMANSPEFLQAAARIGGSRGSGGDPVGTIAEQAIASLFGSNAASGGTSAPGGGATAAGGGSGQRLSIVELGRKLQGTGLRVREHEAFGGVGRHSPNSLHYSGRALDLTDWQDPGESQASWLPRKRFLGERFSQIMGGQGEIFGPHNDPKGHGTHIHVGLPSGSIPVEVAQQLAEARSEALRKYPLRWAG